MENEEAAPQTDIRTCRGTQFYCNNFYIVAQLLGMLLRFIMPTKRKFYAVANGYKTGIFKTWADCKDSVHGYPGAKYKSFKTEALATEYLRCFTTSSIPSSTIEGASNVHGFSNAKKRNFSASSTSTEDIDVLTLKRHRANRNAENKDIQQSCIPVWKDSRTEKKTQKELTDNILDAKRKFSIDELQGLLMKVNKDGLKLPRKAVQSILSKSPNSQTASFNMWSDGGSNPNPGPGGAGFMICGPLGKEQIILKGRLYLGEHCTNNIAEYTGFIFGLKFANYIGISELKTHVDSQLVEKQLKGQYRVNDPDLKMFHKFATDIVKQSFDSFEVNWIERAMNSEADALATKAMHDKKKLYVTAYHKKDQNTYT